MSFDHHCKTCSLIYANKIILKFYYGFLDIVMPIREDEARGQQGMDIIFVGLIWSRRLIVSF